MADKEETKKIEVSEQDNTFDKEIKKRKVIDYATLITFIALIVTILPIQTWINNFIISLQPIEFYIKLQEGYSAELLPNLIIKNNNYEILEQEINVKVNDNVEFSHNIKNIGINYLDNYKIQIFVVDSDNLIRGQLNLTNEEIIENKKFKTLFNFPPKNEKIYGTWNIYSLIFDTNNTLISIIKQPFIVEVKDPWYYDFIVIGVILIGLIINTIFDFTNKKIKIVKN